MTDESLRFGLIGAGFIGQTHGLAINAVNRVFGTRPPRAVGNEDWAGALPRFPAGALGTAEVGRIAHGRKMDIAFELVCERGTLAFAGERLDELQPCVGGDPVGVSGFRTIHVNDAHPDHGAFIPAPEQASGPAAPTVEGEAAGP